LFYQEWFFFQFSNTDAKIMRIPKPTSKWNCLGYHESLRDVLKGMKDGRISWTRLHNFYINHCWWKCELNFIHFSCFSCFYLFILFFMWVSKHVLLFF